MTQDDVPAAEDRTEPAKTPRNFDPDPGRRIWVQSSVTGDVGWLVRRDGQERVRLDRPNQEIVVDFNGNWTQIVEHRRIAHSQLVRVAFEADRELMRLLGHHDKARKEFRDLGEKQLAAWIEEGPKEPPIRALLYRSIMDTLTEHTVG